MKLLILGRNGQLGSALLERAADPGGVTALGRDDLDLADPAALERAVATIRPAVVLNAAAYTAVDRAEQERDLAFRINAQAPAALAAACARHGALLLHYSTDYVFDGAKAGRYLETDATGPLNVYGASKLAGEREVLGSGAAAIVLRTTWVYGDHGGNFARTMLRLATERDALRVVADQHGAPTWAGRLADLSLGIARRAMDSGDVVAWGAAHGGLYHASAAGETNWADYARCVLRTAAAQPSFATRLRARAESVEPIPAAAYPTPARRPANSLLDSGLLERTFGYAMPHWEHDLVPFVQRLAAAPALEPAKKP
jgi:dTDP-4-dehydrorhamnose reductase